MAWLRGLGLEQYASAFRDNDVDGDVLPDLTAEDLIALGVTSVGHRRKLLSAIAALGPALPAPAVTATPASLPPPAPALAQAERRRRTPQVLQHRWRSVHDPTWACTTRRWMAAVSALPSASDSPRSSGRSTLFSRAAISSARPGVPSFPVI